MLTNAVHVLSLASTHCKFKVFNALKAQLNNKYGHVPVKAHIYYQL